VKNTYENLTFRTTTAVDYLVEDEQNLAELVQLEQRFIEEMDDDFNAANGITVVYELVKRINQYNEQAEVSAAVLAKMGDLLTTWLAIFGIEFQKDEALLDTDIEPLIAERNQARSDRNFARSDEIRDLLKEQGIILEDTPQGTRWRRSE